MPDVFHACTLPWRVWPWGVTLKHSDSDVTPECSVEFGGMIARSAPSYEELWVVVEFELAAFAAAKPHRDDESLVEVSGYDVIPMREEHSEEAWQRQEAEWLRTGTCPDPGFYYSVDSEWLCIERRGWAERQRTSRSPEAAVHFVVDGRDGYVEVLAAGFAWRAWHPGYPMLSAVSGEPTMSGRWTDGAATQN